MTTTTRTPTAAAAARPEELAPLSRIDRLALATGLQLMLWSARRAQGRVRTARCVQAQLSQHQAARDALLRDAGFGPR